MKKNNCSKSLFSEGYRASGVVLDVAALPSPYGIGDLGPSSLAWVDRLHQAGQSWWHALQSGRSKYCDSEYQSRSAFAGNALLISPDWLIEDGLLTARDCQCVALPAGSIDYDVVVPFKHWLLEKAWKKFRGGTRKDLLASYEKFRTGQKHWLEDYALFCALKAKYRGAPYGDWGPELARRTPLFIANARHEMTSQIDRVRFSQFLLFRQAQRLKEYAHAKGVRLIGDLSFTVAADSSDAWACPELFAADPSPVATNLDPVCFSSNGRMGPDRDQGVLSRVSCRWCVDRLRALLAHVDVARVDVHALASPRCATAGDLTARVGEENSDVHLTGVSGLMGDGHARDLMNGFAFRGQFHVPQTRVLQFAFDGRPDNPHLPQKYTPNSVAYTGIHDEVRTREWYDGLPDREQRGLWNYLNRPSGESAEVSWELIRLAWSSAAALAMVPFPDLLNLEQTRTNGDAGGHRRWRCTEEMLSAPALQWLRELTAMSNRSIEVRERPKRAAVLASRPRTMMEAAL